MAGITSAAPRPSMSDQPRSNTDRFGLSAVVSDPAPYTPRPIAKTRSLPQMSPNLAPTSMNAAITSVYAVIASCTPWMVVSRSATICEIDTFMTLLSSTITNCAEPRITMGSHFRNGQPSKWPQFGYESAWDLSHSYSSRVIAPLSSRLLAFAISDAAPSVPEPATD